MRIREGIRQVFGHFHNLNLLALMHDLQVDWTAREDWAAGKRLCPVAHGFASGAQVREVNVMVQHANLRHACQFAAECLGAKPDAVARFVHSWDDHVISRDRLAAHLQEIWEERLADAEAVQRVLDARSARMCDAIVDLTGHFHAGL